MRKGMGGTGERKGGEGERRCEKVSESEKQLNGAMRSKKSKTTRVECESKERANVIGVFSKGVL